jgi:hypothetical protein
MRRHTITYSLGWAALFAVVIGTLVMLPDLRRYVRIERM